HQVGPVVRVAGPGRADRGRGRGRVAVRPARPPARARLPADHAIHSGPDPAALLPHARGRHRRALAAGPRAPPTGAAGPGPAAAALDVPPAPRWDVQHRLFGTRVLNLDDLNAPLLPTVALLYLLTAVATGRTKLQRFSFPWSLASLGLQMAAFGCTRPWVLI